MMKGSKGGCAGNFIEWHKNGAKKLNCNYDKGILNGPWVEFYEDGKTKMIEKSYNNGSLDGTLTHYKADGAVKYKKKLSNHELTRKKEESKQN